jgi:hypothetical protein
VICAFFLVRMAMSWRLVTPAAEAEPRLA